MGELIVWPVVGIDWFVMELEMIERGFVVCPLTMSKLLLPWMFAKLKMTGVVGGTTSVELDVDELVTVVDGVVAMSILSLTGAAVATAAAAAAAAAARLARFLCNSDTNLP